MNDATRDRLHRLAQEAIYAEVRATEILTTKLEQPIRGSNDE